MREHVAVRGGRNRVDVRRQLVDVAAPIELDELLGVDGQLLVRIHGDDDAPDEGVDRVVIVADLQVLDELGLADVVEKHGVVHALLFLDELAGVQHLDRSVPPRRAPPASRENRSVGQPGKKEA